jgi:hypothetical protein
MQYYQISTCLNMSGVKSVAIVHTSHGGVKGGGVGEEL